MKLFSKVISLFKKATKAVKSKSVRSTKVKGQTKTIGKHLEIVSVVVLALFCVTVLSLSIRGIAGNPSAGELNRAIWKDDGPLELSPERGRYALLYSITENNSLTFTSDIARFAAPDVGYKNGKYVSLFAPAVSYIVVPGYFLGKSVGLAQVGTFAVISLFALFNFFLIRAIAKRLGASSVASTIGAIVFLFASPAFAYAVTLYQHHISTFLILSSIYLLIRSRSLLSLTVIWLLCGIAIAVDYPNFFMMIPIGVVALARSIVIEKTVRVTRVSLHFMRLLVISIVIFPMAFFFWFNMVSYGNPFTLSGSAERAIEVKPNGQPALESDIQRELLEKKGYKNIEVEEKVVTSFFNPRKIMDGFYTHLLSLDRGMILYTPVMFFGILGFFFLNKREKYFAALLAGIIGFNIVFYSMWADPYGGWAFGSRYLIPTYSLLSIFVAMLLTKWNRNIIFIILFFMMFAYSVGVNTLGAITSNRNPPQVEAQGLEQKSGIKQEYTYVRNIQLMDSGISKSYMYQTYFSHLLTPRDYFTYLTGFIVVVASALLGYQTVQAFRNKNITKVAEVKARVIQRRKEIHAV